MVILSHTVSHLPACLPARLSVCMCGYVSSCQVSPAVCIGWKMVSYSLELLSSTNFLAWVLGTEPTFFGKVLRALKPLNLKASLQLYLVVYISMYFVCFLYHAGIFWCALCMKLLICSCVEFPAHWESQHTSTLLLLGQCGYVVSIVAAVPPPVTEHKANTRTAWFPKAHSHHAVIAAVTACIVVGSMRLFVHILVDQEAEVWT